MFPLSASEYDLIQTTPFLVDWAKHFRALGELFWRSCVNYFRVPKAPSPKETTFAEMCIKTQQKIVEVSVNIQTNIEYNNQKSFTYTLIIFSASTVTTCFSIPSSVFQFFNQFFQPHLQERLHKYGSKKK